MPPAISLYPLYTVTIKICLWLIVIRLLSGNASETVRYIQALYISKRERQSSEEHLQVLQSAICY